MFDFSSSDSPSVPSDDSSAGDVRSDDAAKFACTLCGAGMYGAQCKLICPNCGYREDCSDLFRAD